MLSKTQFKPVNPATAQMKNANPAMQQMQRGPSMEHMRNNTPKISMPQMSRPIINKF